MKTSLITFILLAWVSACTSSKTADVGHIKSVSFGPAVLYTESDQSKRIDSIVMALKNHRCVKCDTAKVAKDLIPGMSVTLASGPVSTLQGSLKSDEYISIDGERYVVICEGDSCVYYKYEYTVGRMVK
jgi:hypothetical protein